MVFRGKLLTVMGLALPLNLARITRFEKAPTSAPSPRHSSGPRLVLICRLIAS